MLGTGAAGRAQEQDPAPAAEQPAEPGGEEPVPAADYDAIQATIDRMRARLEGMGQAAAERDRALSFLEEQIDRAAGRIAGGDETKERFASGPAPSTRSSRRSPTSCEQLTETVDQRAALIANLEQQVSRLTEMLAGEQVLVSQLEGDLDARDATLAEVTEQQETLEAELEATQAARQALDEELAALRRRRPRPWRSARRRSPSSRPAIRPERDRRSAWRTRGSRRSAASSPSSTGGSAPSSLLDSSENRIVEQQGTIASTGASSSRRCSIRVEELSQYRWSSSAGCTRGAGRPAECASSATGSSSSPSCCSPRAPPGSVPRARQLEALAETLREVAATIPPEIDWILGVDGHTDKVPVGANSAFRSNWELSTARAISVVEFLVRGGSPPERLFATGFGEFQPLDRRDDEIAYRRNRADRVQAHGRIGRRSNSIASSSIATRRTTLSPCCWHWPRPTGSRCWR
ncbi:MAG: OmpA family protein [Geminicoccaceae bacterium]